MSRLLYILCIVWSCFPVSAVAQSSDTQRVLFDKATENYNTGNYQTAIGEYQKIIQSGYESSSLYYNLANAHYKLNQLPESIYYYEKALKLNPEDEDVRNNLSFAQQMTIDVITPLPQTWLKRVSDSITSWFTIHIWQLFPIIGVFLFVIFFLLYYFFQQTMLKRIFFTAMGISLLGSIGTYFIADFHKKNIDSQEFAILFDNTVRVYTEPNTYSTEAFILHQGTKVGLLENLNEWVKIRLADGKTGWVKRSVLRVI
ncbi:MAG: tetratricopeptide repeat protein [Capnocytophaga sp.]|nr:tetratricopeptide repeat protein [Capnocytophaga sp.]